MAKEKQAKPEKAAEVKRADVSPAEKGPPPRLRKHYEDAVVPAIMERFGIENRWAVPRLLEVVVNMGVGQGKEDVKYFEQIKDDLGKLAAQAPLVCRAKKSIAGFKIRKGQAIGLKVTLRRSHMWEFVDRLGSIALPRIRDFRGLDPRAFDSTGNYNLGVREHHIFVEVDLEKSPKPHGMNVSFVMTPAPKEQAQAVLAMLGLPFKKPAEKKV